MTGSDAAGRAERSRRSGRVLPLALPFLFWSAFALFAGVHTYLSMLSHHHSLPRLLLYEQIAILFWAVAAAPIAWLTRRVPLVPWRWTRGLVHAASASAFSAAYVVWSTGWIVGLRPYDDRGIQAFGPGLMAQFGSTFPLGVLLYAGTVGAVLACDYYEISRRRAIREAQLERELAQARLDALTNQLQPHFLFNALHTVSGLIRGGEPRAAITTLAGLSDLLRYSLDGRAGPESPLHEEIDAVRGYLEIQRLRYDDRPAVHLDVEPAALGAMVPRLLLQPLIENAFHHGAMPAVGPWIRLQARRAGGMLDIRIENSAVAGHRSNGLGIGLRNTQARLEQLYGAMARLDVEREAGRFTVRIELPWNEQHVEGVGGA